MYVILYKLNRNGSLRSPDLRGRLNIAKKPGFAGFFMRPSSAQASLAAFRRIKKPTLSGGLFGFVAGTGLEPVTFGL